MKAWSTGPITAPLAMRTTAVAILCTERLCIRVPWICAARNPRICLTGELYYTIQNGIMLSGMPAFGAPGDHDLDSWKLVAFIRHLPALSQLEEVEMEKMNPKSPEELEEEK